MEWAIPIEMQLFNRLEDNVRQKQFEKIVLQMKEHLGKPTLSLFFYIMI